jgi:hypothetical protein
MNLIRVNHSGLGVEVHIAPNVRRNAFCINPKEVEFDRGQPAKKIAEFFMVENDEDVDATVAELARLNPGKEIMVYRLKSVSICPAAEMLTKAVSDDGILPVF